MTHLFEESLTDTLWTPEPPQGVGLYRNCPKPSHRWECGAETFSHLCATSKAGWSCINRALI